MKTLEQYFRDAPIIDHALRHSIAADGKVTFYIHPSGAGGDTLDFVVSGNLLSPDPAKGHPPFEHYPPGMGEESRRLHREYFALVAAQRTGAHNRAEVIRVTDECAAKGIVLVPGGENL